MRVPVLLLFVAVAICATLANPIQEKSKQPTKKIIVKPSIFNNKKPGHSVLKNNKPAASKNAKKVLVKPKSTTPAKKNTPVVVAKKQDEKKSPAQTKVVSPTKKDQPKNAEKPKAPTSSNKNTAATKVVSPSKENPKSPPTLRAIKINPIVNYNANKASMRDKIQDRFNGQISGRPVPVAPQPSSQPAPEPALQSGPPPKYNAFRSFVLRESAKKDKSVLVLTDAEKARMAAAGIPKPALPATNVAVPDTTVHRIKETPKVVLSNVKLQSSRRIISLKCGHTNTIKNIPNARSICKNEGKAKIVESIRRSGLPVNPIVTKDNTVKIVKPQLTSKVDNMNLPSKEKKMLEKFNNIIQSQRIRINQDKENVKPASVVVAPPKPTSVVITPPKAPELPKPASVVVVPPKPASVVVAPPKPASVVAVPPKPASVVAVPPKPASVVVVPSKPASVIVAPPKAPELPKPATGKKL